MLVVGNIALSCWLRGEMRSGLQTSSFRLDSLSFFYFKLVIFSLKAIIRLSIHYSTTFFHIRLGTPLDLETDFDLKSV